DRSDPELVDNPGPIQTVALHLGGLATSSTTARRWRRGGSTFHHIIDPRSGRSTTSRWRTVSVASASCVAANTASTAAIVADASAPQWLKARGAAARLVSTDGAVTAVGGWPTAEAAA
ncbi:MAG: FAD:protein transferase, partial [Frankiaceae bacterium]|nr:FAD:protein transferase [Frankiaceae bacterium]